MPSYKSIEFSGSRSCSCFIISLVSCTSTCAALICHVLQCTSLQTSSVGCQGCLLRSRWCTSVFNPWVTLCVTYVVSHKGSSFAAAECQLQARNLFISLAFAGCLQGLLGTFPQLQVQQQQRHLQPKFPAYHTCGLALSGTLPPSCLVHCWLTHFCLFSKCLHGHMSGAVENHCLQNHSSFLLRQASK